MALSLGEELATYLQSAGLGLNYSGAGTINMFVSLLPDAPDMAAAVLERGGLPPIMTFTGQGQAESTAERPVVQVKVRSAMTDYNSGNTLIQGIFKALQGVTETTLTASGSVFNLIQAQQSPIYLGRDDRQRHEWSQNYLVMWNNNQRA